MSTERVRPLQEPALAVSGGIALPWGRVALGAIVLLSAVLSFGRLDAVGLGNLYYAAAVRSMSSNWHAFFFASLDPGGFVSIDKPPLAFWVQVLSVKLFGFNGISLLLPEALAGVLSVALLYHLIARVFGRPAGLLAALTLALTPVLVVVDRSNIVESQLVLAILLGAWAVLRATESGRLRLLLIGAALVGLGFNIKMLEAYLVVPALAVTYFLGSPRRWPIRLAHLAAAGAVLVAVSLAWVMAVDLTPASQRPYVGSSGDNSELSLALGYNGLGRFTGNIGSFLHGGANFSNLTPTDLGFTSGEGGPAGIDRLVNARLGGQASWLIGLAIVGIVAVLWRRRVRLPLDARQQAVVLWGSWLATGGAFFSMAGFFHAYYLATIAPPIAALVGIAISTLWQDYTSHGWRGWTLPIALLVAAAVEAHILGFFTSWNAWLGPTVLIGTGLAALVLLLARARQFLPRAAAVAVLSGAIALLLVPSAVWSQYSVANAAQGNAPSAGPQVRGGFFGGPFAGGFRDRPGSAFRRPGGLPVGRPGFDFPPGGAGGRFPAFSGGGFRFGHGSGRYDSTSADPALVHYLESHQGSTKYLLATENAGEAEPFILSTDRPVMDLGGFMGADRIVDPAQLARLVAANQVHYFLISGGGRDFSTGPPPVLGDAFRNRGGFPGGFGGGRNANGDVVQWVQNSCRAIPSSAYHASSLSLPGGIGFGGQQLYFCKG